MEKSQLKSAGILVFSNLFINLSGFLRQIIMAWFMGVSAQVDLLLLAMIVPAIIQSMIGGGAGEIMVIKRENPGFREGSFEAIFIFSCLLPVALLGLLYFSVLGIITPFFEIDINDTILFRNLSLIFIANMIPGTFVSVLRPHLYSKGYYGFYSVSSILSQVAGIIFILLTVKSLGIYSFAWSFLLAGFINAIWFSFRSGLYVPGLFRISVWKYEFKQLVILFKRIFSLSVQTLINHFAVFWERSLSVKYLSGGYLSSLNYSKTLSELPNSVILSSVLTTSYIEQVKLHKTDSGKFGEYTARTLNLLLKTGFLFQAVMLLLAPVIIILIFRRGKFDNDAVRSALIIFNILTVGFLPKLIMNFFSRTMYILGDYRKLLMAIIYKFIVQLSLMLILIRSVNNAVPLAIIAGYLFVSLILFINVGRKITLPALKSFIFKLSAISIISMVLLLIHIYTIEFYIEFSNLQIFIWSVPLLVISLMFFVFFVRRNGLDNGLIDKIIGKLWKKSI